MTNRGPSKPRRPNPHPKTFTADKGPPGWRWHLPYIILVSSAQCEATCQETWKGRCKYYQAVFLVYTYLKIKMYIYIYMYMSMFLCMYMSKPKRTCRYSSSEIHATKSAAFLLNGSKCLIAAAQQSMYVTETAVLLLKSSDHCSSSSPFP